MSNQKRIIYVFVLLSVLLIALIIYKAILPMTGFVLNEQRLLINLDIHSDQQKIIAGQSLLLEIAIREPGGNIEQTSIIDLEYLIKDLDGNVISSKKESGAIAVKQSEITSLFIPTKTKSGIYVASVEVDYKGEKYVGSKTFEVSSGRTLNISSKIIMYIIIIVIILIIIILIIRFRKKRLMSYA